MTIVRTDFGITREKARGLRFEKVSQITATNVQKAIEQASSIPGAISATPVVFAQSPYTVLPTDYYIYVDTSGGAVTLLLGEASARLGVPLVIKDVTGNANTNNITITRAAAETIDGLTSIIVSADFGGYRLNPRSGVGYTVSP